MSSSSSSLSLGRNDQEEQNYLDISPVNVHLTLNLIELQGKNGICVADSFHLLWSLPVTANSSGKLFQG